MVELYIKYVVEYFFYLYHQNSYTTSNLSYCFQIVYLSFLFFPIIPVKNRCSIKNSIDFLGVQVYKFMGDDVETRDIDYLTL